MASDRPRRKPGPKGIIRNPRPVRISEDESSDWIAADELDYTERRLREHFRRAVLRRLPHESYEDATYRILRIVREALTESPAARWSGRHVVEIGVTAARRSPSPYWATRHSGPTPPRRPADGCLWADTSTAPEWVKRWDKRSKSWRATTRVPAGVAPEAFLEDLSRPLPSTSFEWTGLWRMRPSIHRMLVSDMGRAGRSGRPTYLACAVLAELLEVTPDRIADLINNFRHPRSRRR